MKFETVRIHFLSDALVCCHAKIVLLWQRDLTTSPLYYRNFAELYLRSMSLSLSNLAIQIILRRSFQWRRRILATGPCQKLQKPWSRALFAIFQRPVSPLRSPSVIESSQNIALYLKRVFVRFMTYLLRSIFHMTKVAQLSFSLSSHPTQLF